MQLGRQNGKSFLNGILAAYYGNFEKYVTMDGEVVATKVYSKVEEKFTDEIKRRR